MLLPPLSVMLVALNLDGVIGTPYLPPTSPAIVALSIWTLKALSAILFYMKEGEISLPRKDLLFSLSKTRIIETQTRTFYIKRYLFRFSCYLSAVILFQLQPYVPKWAFLVPITGVWGRSIIQSLKPEVNSPFLLIFRIATSLETPWCWAI